MKSNEHLLKDDRGSIGAGFSALVGSTTKVRREGFSRTGGPGWKDETDM